MTTQKQDKQRAKKIMAQFNMDEAERERKKWTLTEELVYAEAPANPDANKRGKYI